MLDGMFTADPFREYPMPSLEPVAGLIACSDRNGGIGRDGGLLFDFPNDLRFFRAVTRGSAVIMGRKTWESLPRRPLPDRCSIVLSRTMPEREDCIVVRTPEEAIAAVPEDMDSWVIGGGEVYTAMLPYCRRAVVTVVDDEKDADTFLPDLDAAFRFSRKNTPQGWDRIDGTVKRYWRYWYGTR